MHYQPKKNNPYILPHDLYMCVLYIIRDYERLETKYSRILHASPLPPDGQPKGSDTSDPTADKAIRLEAISRHMVAVEQALILVPQEYRRGIMDNIMYRAWYPRDAHPSTYRRWKQRFVFYVAKNLKLI